MSDGVEEKSATAAEATAGVRFGAGHSATLVITDRRGRPPFKTNGGARTEQRRATLGNLRWGGADFAHCHGVSAEMLVDARDAEGASLIFSAEVFHAGSWSKLKNVVATVEGGTARASLPMEHPAATSESADRSAAQVRFSVRFAQGNT